MQKTLNVTKKWVATHFQANYFDPIVSFFSLEYNIDYVLLVVISDRS